ncbi:MAG TPA: HI0074 family nucleotidyltransferase substrate-binding subunit [Candidatus Babeliales bacterium]|nr:HI0074 family nucleotidyltransferase substrate-binding subunit [Candidatus Babeliales bacterium]
MERINKKITLFLEALKTLEEGIALFYEYKIILDKQTTDKNEQLFTSMRDSMIQRFEYCTDLFWKLVKVYLEDVERIDLPVNSPRAILREAVKARILSEREGDECMDMVQSRNKTSHTYHQVMAEEIAHEIPQYYELMKKIIDRVMNVIAEK